MVSWVFTVSQRCLGSDKDIEEPGCVRKVGLHECTKARVLLFDIRNF
jgi:hypothetical protein